VALVATAFTWPLLFVGGLVTTYRFGMAVPDWPTTFGANMFLYDMADASRAVLVEHGHRLYGAAVGLGCIILALWFTAVGRDRRLTALAWLALAAVIVQGLLGGLRVLRNSTDLALVHGCFAQAFFGLMVAICVLTGRTWACGPGAGTDPAYLRRRALWTLGLVYAQVVVGAILRHRGAGPMLGPLRLNLAIHATLGLAVWGHAVALAIRVLGRRAALPALAPSAWAMLAVATIQIGLGVASWWVLRPFDGIPRDVEPYAALIRTGHQANGALLLAASVVLLLRSVRAFGPAPVAKPMPELALEAVG